MAHRLASLKGTGEMGGSNLSDVFFCRSIGDELTPCDQDGRREQKGVLENIFKVVSTRSSVRGEGSSGITWRCFVAEGLFGFHASGEPL